ncbi:hypothetical protein BHE74_00001371 [Ensete ventricosum]|nr:hypothetical protein BHE74_00001371 [Ensete ventricosum]
MAEETESKAPEAPPAAEVVVPETEEKKPEAEEAVPPADEAAATVPESTSLEEESNVVAEPVDPQKKALDELKQLVQAALSNNEFNPPPAPAKEEPPVKEEEEEAKPAEAPAAATVEESKPSSEPVSAQEAKPSEAPAPASVEESKTRSEPVPAPAERSLEPEVVEDHASPVKKEPLPPPSQPAEEKAAAADDATTKTVKAIEEAVGPAAVEDVSPAAKEAPAPAPTAPPEEVFIWGVPLVGDEKSDAVLLKFLRARDFKVKDALAMLKDAVIWRKQFGIEALLEEDLGLPELDKVVYMHGIDKEGHPVCYNVYGEFQNKELYEKAFGDADKRRKFLKWRIQYLEKGIGEHLDFTPGGISSMVQVTDLRNSPRLGKHRQVTKQAVTLLQDNYPEFISKKVPVAFGGLLNKEKDPDFSTADGVTDVSIKPSSKQTIEIPATETCLIVWELRVLGCEVSYGAEFTPSAEDGYTVIVQKNRKLAADDEPVIKGSFKTGEPGKVVLNLENLTSKKKLLLYRYKVKSSTGST